MSLSMWINSDPPSPRSCEKIGLGTTSRESPLVRGTAGVRPTGLTTTACSAPYQRRGTKTEFFHSFAVQGDSDPEIARGMPTEDLLTSSFGTLRGSAAGCAGSL